MSGTRNGNDYGYLSDRIKQLEEYVHYSTTTGYLIKSEGLQDFAVVRVTFSGDSPWLSQVDAGESQLRDYLRLLVGLPWDKAQKKIKASTKLKPVTIERT